MKNDLFKSLLKLVEGNNSLTENIKINNNQNIDIMHFLNTSFLWNWQGKDNASTTFLHRAVSKEDIEIVQLLIRNGADPKGQLIIPRVYKKIIISTLANLISYISDSNNLSKIKNQYNYVSFILNILCDYNYENQSIEILGKKYNLKEIQ